MTTLAILKNGPNSNYSILVEGFKFSWLISDSCNKAVNKYEKEDLMITVTSLDNATSDCRISITANDMKSYQNTVSFYSVKVTGVYL
jgi:hypothetical protein